MSKETAVKEKQELHPLEVEVIKHITPMLPQEFWGTEEEAMARQLKQLVFAEINVMTIIAYSWQDWLKDNPNATEAEQALTYALLISISSGTLTFVRENGWTIGEQQRKDLETIEPYYKSGHQKARKYLVPIWHKYGSISTQKYKKFLNEMDGE